LRHIKYEARFGRRKKSEFSLLGKKKSRVRVSRSIQMVELHKNRYDNKIGFYTQNNRSMVIINNLDEFFKVGLVTKPKFIFCPKKHFWKKTQTTFSEKIV